LIGANSDELGIIPSFLKGLFAGRLIGQLGMPEDRLQAIYGDKSAMNADLPSDATFVEPARALAVRAAKSGQSVWTYSFGYVAEAKRKDWRGAPHSSDLGYVFDTLGKLKDPPSPADQATATRWADTWVTFARTGDPGWPRYDPATDQRMTVANDGAGLKPTPDRIRALGALRDDQTGR
jgi:para-nitrobenzyl esterase